MHSYIKNIVLWTLFGGILLAFVLMTDFYPFMRTGMFAEPVRHSGQTEYFIVSYTNTQGDSSAFQPQTIGFSDSKLNYLSRAYYYREESGDFLKNIARVNPNTQKVYLHRILVDLDKKYSADTSVVARYASKN